MEKIKARYLIETNEDQASIRTKGLSFVYTTLSEKQEKSVKKQMSKYLLSVFRCYEYEYDDDDGPSRSYSSKDFEIEDLLSLSSPTYSTDAPCVDILVAGGSFMGVILKATNRGGSGWDNYDEWWYVILYADGTILGKNVSSYSFSGESYSKDEETTYTLIKKEPTNKAK